MQGLALMLLHDVAQMQVWAAVNAEETGNIEDVIVELTAYTKMCEANWRMSQNRSFAMVLLHIMKMGDATRHDMLAHFIESHGMEMYK